MMVELEPLQLLQGFVVQYSLPDPGFQKAQQAKGTLQALGCNFFTTQKEYDASSDGIVVRIFGYITSQDG